MFEIDEKTRLGTGVRLVHQHAPLLQQRLETLQYYVHFCIENWMAGGNKLRLRLAGDQRFFECDAGVPIEHRIASTNETVALLQDRWHSEDFKPPLFALSDPSA